MSLARHIRTIAVTAMLAGTLDGLAAIINYLLAGGKEPIRIFQFIASGVFGWEAASTNESLAWWGVGFHYCIAFSWTIFYFALYPRVKILSRNKYVSGIAYGLFVWMVMNLVVVPLSNTPPLLFSVMRALIGAGILMLCIGLPIALIAHRRYSKAEGVV